MILNVFVHIENNLETLVARTTKGIKYQCVGSTEAANCFTYILPSFVNKMKDNV